MDGSVTGPTAEPVLAVRGLTIAMGERTALTDVTFAVRRGELVAVVGENGAGKSSLVAALSGIVKPVAGSVEVFGRAPVPGDPAVAIVWQDPALCEDMTVLDNLFLGREGGGVFLRRRSMRRKANESLRTAGLPADAADVRVGELSGGARQQLALARALMDRPAVLVLDEPTSALGVVEHLRFESLMRSLRADGVTILLISHRVEQVVALADRVIALRHGGLVADTTPVELTTDDLVSLMSGHASGSSTRRHLTQLSDLVDQLADVAPSASLPLIVSAIASTLGQQQVAVHLRDPEGSDLLALRGSVGLTPARIERWAVVPADRSSTIGRAYLDGENQVDEVVPRSDADAPASMWSVPILGAGAVHGVFSGMADIPGRPMSDQLDVVAVYAGFAAAALERESILRDLSSHNLMLEALRRITDVFATSDATGALPVAVARLGVELAAREIGLVRIDADGRVAQTVLVREDGRAETGVRPTAALLGVRLARLQVIALDQATWLEEGVAAAVRIGEARMVLLAIGPGPDGPSRAADLIRNAAWSFAAAVERERADERVAEARAVERTSAVQRDFVHRLSHELRTPLTTVLGYASTLRQPDVRWDDETRDRFVDLIWTESTRMRRLVRDLLDSSTLAAGVLPILADWCDLSAIVDAAVTASGADATAVVTELGAVPPVWGDHERLQQVFMNVLDNAMRHGASRVRVHADRCGTHVVLRFDDDGPGVDAASSDRLFAPYVNGLTPHPGLGLGLSISRGIVEAHGGSMRFAESQAGAALEVRLPVDPDGGPA